MNILIRGVKRTTGIFISSSRVIFKSLKGCRTYTNLSYIHKIGTEPLRPLTVGNLIEITANKYPEREAVVSIHQNERVTYKEVLEQADQLAAGLKTLGLEKGDKVGLLAPNIVEWVISKIAIARAGLVLVPVNPAFQANEIRYCINKVGMKGLICSHKIKQVDFYEILNDVSPKIDKGKPGRLNCKLTPSLTTIVMISDEILKGTYNYDEVFELADANSVKKIKENQRLIQPDDIFDIQFTSGTTGDAKATVISHFQIVNNSFYLGKGNELDQKHHKICVQIPFFHAFGFVVTIAAAFNFGATLVIPSATYSPVANLYALKEERCTTIHGTPTMYVDLINLQRQYQLDINPEIAFSGGAPCSPQLFKQMQEILKVKRVKSGYGLTEATSAIFHSLPIAEDKQKAIETVGCVSDHLEVKVVDFNNIIVPFGTAGELCVRGYNTMLGYWGDKEKTKEVLGDDGWLRTGDQFILQEDGYGRIIGRLKDIIIRGGENIFPKEIEDLLNTHPDILESHVIGLSHERLGEEICACVRLKKGAELTHKTLVNFCKGKLAYFKIPSQLRIMDSFPKTVSGKIQKYLLKQQLEKLP